MNMSRLYIICLLMIFACVGKQNFIETKEPTGNELNNTAETTEDKLDNTSETKSESEDKLDKTTETYTTETKTKSKDELDRTKTKSENKLDDEIIETIINELDITQSLLKKKSDELDDLDRMKYFLIKMEDDLNKTADTRIQNVLDEKIAEIRLIKHKINQIYLKVVPLMERSWDCAIDFCHFESQLKNNFVEVQRLKAVSLQKHPTLPKLVLRRMINLKIRRNKKLKALMNERSQKSNEIDDKVNKILKKTKLKEWEELLQQKINELKQYLENRK